MFYMIKLSLNTYFELLEWKKGFMTQEQGEKAPKTNHSMPSTSLSQTESLGSSSHTRAPNPRQLVSDSPDICKL